MFINKVLLMLCISIVISIIAFCIHVFDVEIVKPYIAKTMQTMPIKQSWDVRYMAIISSIEIGIGVVLIYHLLHKSIPVNNFMFKGFIYGILLLLINGQLIRQSLMDFLIGNPLHITILQNSISWLIWLVMGMLTAISYKILKI